jgi:hypothetical protein
MSNLVALRDQIEELGKHHHLEILRLIKFHNVPYNENQNGVFINLSNSPPELIDKLTTYLDYAALQKTEIDEGESQREELKESLNVSNVLKTS